MSIASIPATTESRRRRWIRRSIVVAAVIADASACGGGEPRDGLPEYVISELESASEFEREIIGDGEVTAAEYERAVLATLSCLDDHGLPHSEAVFNDGASRWEYHIGPWPEDEDEDNYSLFINCWETHEQAVESVWVNQHAPSESELQAMRDEILRCLREHGLQADDYPTFVESQGQLSPSELEVAFACKSAGYN